jgi:hypothetical protein
MMRAGYAMVADASMDTLTKDEVLGVGDELETLGCQLPTQQHRMLTQLQAQTTPKEVGAKSWRDVLMIRWRLSSAEAKRRLTEAALLGPRRALSGEPLAPVLAATAAAQSLGLITGEHVEVIRKAMARLPGFVDTAARVQIEVDWVRHAVGIGPKQLGDKVARTLFLLDQDGPAPDDAERARRRGVSMGPQQPNGMIDLTARLTPAAGAIFEPLFAKFAAPACATPPTNTPARRAPPARHRSTATPAAWTNAATTRWCSSAATP